MLIGISNGFMAQFSATPAKALGAAIGMALLGLAIYWAFVRLIEKRPARELSASGMGRELSAGVLLGAGLCLLCFVILMLLGTYRIDGVNPVLVVLPALAMAISSGVLEELMWRGGSLRILEEGLGSWIARAVSALVLGLSHYASEEGALWGAFAITIEAGLLSAAASVLNSLLSSWY